MKLFKLISVIMMFQTGMSCGENQRLDEKQNEIDEDIYYYREDTTYVVGPDLSHNLEVFDSINIKRSVEAFDDRSFEKGMILWSPLEGKLVQDAVLSFGYENISPLWTVAQWASKYSLKNAKLEMRPNGDRVYQNVAKTLAVNPDGSFQLEVKGKKEWGTHVKQPGESWPHLYLSQPIYPRLQIPIAKCENIFFSLDGLREYCYNYMDEDVDLRKHTAHVVINLTIQNRNKSSSLHGKYYTIQLPCYDYRYDFAQKINRYDIGSKEVYTGALMYGMSGDDLWDGTFKDGKWHKARKDILPLIMEAWPVATIKGSPLDGADINDFYLATVTIGWEVSGIFDASMRFKNYSIRAVISQ